MSEHEQQRLQKKEILLRIAAGGIGIALAQVLSFFKLFSMPQGGSVTPASMLPIILIGLCFGPKTGFLCAFVFSLLQLIGGYFFHPVQVILDYTLAYTALGLAGFFAAPAIRRTKEPNMLKRLSFVPWYRIVLGTILSMSGRLIFSFISGIVFFGSYAPEGQSIWLYSLLYNGTYLLPEAAITMFILFAIGFSFRMQKTRAA